MGLFGGDSSTEQITEQLSSQGQTEDESLLNQISDITRAGVGVNTGDGFSIGNIGESSVNLTTNNLDGGAIAGAFDTITNALRSLFDSSESNLERTLDFGDRALNFASNTTGGAFALIDDTISDSLNFGRESLETTLGSLEEVLDFGEGILESNNLIAVSAIESANQAREDVTNFSNNALARNDQITREANQTLDEKLIKNGMIVAVVVAIAFAAPKLIKS